MPDQQDQVLFDASASAPAAPQSAAASAPTPVAAPAPETGPVARIKRSVDHYSEVMRNEVESLNPFHAFAAKPKLITFDSLAEGEEIVLILRQSPIAQIGWVMIVITMIFLPIIFSGVPFISNLPFKYTLAGLVLWYMLVMGFALEKFLSWFFSVYIITDERIIDVDFISLIYKDVTSAKIDNIEDITAVTGGALRSIFNYGDVIIQTAGAKPEITFESVPQPSKVTKLLNELLLEEEREQLEGRAN